MKAVVDNDVVLKGVCYGILQKILAPHSTEENAIGVLGASRFVITKRIKRAKLKGDADSVLQRLQIFLAGVETLEPTTTEQYVAARFEAAAQELGLSLDSGESQLCAIVIERLIPLLLTGDKRAIKAIERLLDGATQLQGMCGKVKCFEQAINDALEQAALASWRIAICAEPGIDKALTICFGCSSPKVELKTVVEGLNSYITALRKDAGRVLALSS